MQHNFPSTRFFRFVGVHFSFAVCSKSFFLSMQKPAKEANEKKQVERRKVNLERRISTHKKRSPVKLGLMLVAQWYMIRLFVLSVNSGFWALIFDFEFETIFKCVSVPRMRGWNGTLTTTLATENEAVATAIGAKMPAVQEETILLCKCFNALFSRSWFYIGSVN